MIIECSDETVKEMVALACNASIPVGMGFLHARPGEYFIPENFTIQHGGLYIDYMDGRMVKFNARKTNVWVFPDTIDIEYQSWKRRYEDYTALYAAAKTGMEKK